MIGESPAQIKGTGIDKYAETAPGPFQSCCKSCWRSHKSGFSIARYPVWYFEENTILLAVVLLTADDFGVPVGTFSPGQAYNTSPERHADNGTCLRLNRYKSASAIKCASRSIWRGTVYHGIPEDPYHLHETPGEYLAFLGRICPEQRDRAIEIAKRSGRKLKIAAKVDPADREYFSDYIKPLLNHPLIELIGEIGQDQKDEFLTNALALLFPIDWPEPFGWF